MGIIIIIGGIAVFIILIITVSAHFEKKRTEALMNIALSMNLKFAKKDDEGLQSGLGNFKLFSRGHSKKITNIMKGEIDNISMIIMDYRYTTGHGKHSHTYNQSVILFSCNDLQLPHFTLSPESFFHKIGSMLGFKDINFNTHPVFSSKYLLKGSEENSIKSVFNHGVLDYFSNNHGLSVEGISNSLIVYRTSKRLKPEEIRSFLEESLTILALFRSGV
jgi:hypothetical protein